MIMREILHQFIFVEYTEILFVLLIL
jgi:hypothetical protein